MPPFLILHGYEGNAPGHWQTWLADELRAVGEEVAYPNLPDPFHPRLDAWLAALRDELGRMRERPVVICHSLACLLWLHHGRPRDAAHVLLVAPPSPLAAPPELSTFFPVPLDQDRAAGATLVYADDDPWCPEGAGTLYAGPLAMPTERIIAGGHLNTDAGYGPWPAMLAWARSGAKNGIDT